MLIFQYLLNKVISIKDLKKEILNGHYENVKYLLNRGVRFGLDPHETNPFGIGTRNNQTLVIACTYGHLDIIKYLIKQENAFETNPLGDFYSVLISAPYNSSLIAACINGHLNVVKYYIKNKYNIHAQDDWIMISACQYGQLNIVKYLLEEYVPFYVQKRKLPDDNREKILSEPFGIYNILTYRDWALQAVCRYGHYSIVKYLIDTSYIPNPLIDNQNRQAIINVCIYGYLDIIKYLIEDFRIKFPDINIRTKIDNILILVCKYGHLDIIKYLIEEEIGLDSLDANNVYIIEELLNTAFEYKHFNIVKYLIHILESKEININCNNVEYYNIARRNRQQDISEYFENKLTWWQRLFSSCC